MSTGWSPTPPAGTQVGQARRPRVRNLRHLRPLGMDVGVSISPSWIGEFRSCVARAEVPLRPRRRVPPQPDHHASLGNAAACYDAGDNAVEASPPAKISDRAVATPRDRGFLLRAPRAGATPARSEGLFVAAALFADVVVRDPKTVASAAAWRSWHFCGQTRRGPDIPKVSSARSRSGSLSAFVIVHDKKTPRSPRRRTPRFHSPERAVTVQNLATGGRHVECFCVHLRGAAPATVAATTPAPRSSRTLWFGSRPWRLRRRGDRGVSVRPDVMSAKRPIPHWVAPMPT